jgi:Putative Ig domain
MVWKLVRRIAQSRATRGPHAARWIVSLACLLSGTLACRGLGGPASLAFSPDQLPAATVGQAYQAVITVTQNSTPVGQMSVGLADLPPGMNFAFIRSQNAAEISGTPSRAGTYQFTVSAWCFGTNVSGQTGHHDYQLVVQ